MKRWRSGEAFVSDPKIPPMHASRSLDYDNENDFHVNFLVAHH